MISSTTPTGTTTGALAPVPAPVRRERNGAITIAALIDEYMLAYVGRDSTRAQRLRWWITQLGEVRLVDLTDDHIYFALDDLAAQRGRFFAGMDADGNAIYKAKGAPLAVIRNNSVRRVWAPANIRDASRPVSI